MELLKSTSGSDNLHVAGFGALQWAHVTWDYSSPLYWNKIWVRWYSWFSFTWSGLAVLVLESDIYWKKVAYSKIKQDNTMVLKIVK